MFRLLLNDVMIIFRGIIGIVNLDTNLDDLTGVTFSNRVVVFQGLSIY